MATITNTSSSKSLIVRVIGRTGETGETELDKFILRPTSTREVQPVIGAGLKYAFHQAGEADSLGSLLWQGPIRHHHAVDFNPDIPLPRMFPVLSRTRLKQTDLDDYKSKIRENKIRYDAKKLAVTLDELSRHAQSRDPWGHQAESPPNPPAAREGIDPCEIETAQLLIDVFFLFTGFIGLYGKLSPRAVEEVVDIIKPHLASFRELTGIFSDESKSTADRISAGFRILKLQRALRIDGAFIAAITGSLSWWDDVLFCVMGLAEIVAAVASEGASTVAMVVAEIANLGTVISEGFVEYEKCRPRVLGWCWESLGTQPGVKIALPIGVTVVGHVPHVFIADDRHHLWAQIFENNAWNWHDLGRPNESTTVVKSVGVLAHDGGAYAFVLGGDGHLWLNQKGSWQDLKTPKTDVRVVGSAGVTLVDDRPYAFVVGSDDRLWVHYWEGGWKWGDLGKPAEIAAVKEGMFATTTRTDGIFPSYYPACFVVGGEQKHIWSCQWDGGKWIWENRHGGMTAAVGMASLKGPVVQHFATHAFIVGEDGFLSVCTWSKWGPVKDALSWRDWSKLKNPSAAIAMQKSVGSAAVLSPHAPSPIPEDPFVFVLDAGGRLWYGTASGIDLEPWTWEQHGRPRQGAVTGVGVAVLDQHPCAFVIAEGELWVRWIQEIKKK